MNAFTHRIGCLAALVAFSTAGVSIAHESHPRAEAVPPQHGKPPASVPYAGAGQPAMDPLMRALVIGIAANILREAAAQPDPVDALGNAVERRVVAALADPNTMRLVESALRHAFQDAPLELREPLALFASSVLHSMRREMLQDMGPRRRY
jgi:hypothetical protein